MDVGSVVNAALANWIAFALVIVTRQLVSHEGFRSFRLKLSPMGLLLYVEGAAAAVGSWLIRGLFMVLTGRSTVALLHPGRDFWLALLWAAISYLPVTLFEETLFRGYVQDKLTMRIGSAAAIVVQAAIFGPLHLLSRQSFAGNLLKVVMVSVLGVAMGTSARSGRSLLWGVGFHHWWNITESLLQGPSSPVQFAVGGLTGSTFAGWVGLGSAVVVLGLTRLRFSGRADEVGARTADACLLSSASGHSIGEISPTIAEEGEPTIDPGII